MSFYSAFYLFLVFLLSSVSCQAQAQQDDLMFFEITNITRVENISQQESPYEGISFNGSGRCHCITTRQSNGTAEGITELTEVPEACRVLNISNQLYSITVTERANNSSSDDDNGMQLLDSIQTLNNALASFESLLTRTVVCLYFNNCDEKNECLRAYVNWLCMTQLKLYKECSDTTDTPCSNPTDSITGANGRRYTRVKPCIGACKDVLRHCPYYLPSSFQRSGNTSEFVYGGYPAFACPVLVNNQSISSYDDTENCIGNGSLSTAAVTAALFIVLAVVCTFLTVM